MKAIIYTEYGSPDVLKLKNIDKPIPEVNEILIQIHATSVGYGDLTARNFGNIPPSKFNMPLVFWLPARLFFGLRKPKINILGSEFAGVVEAIGKEVTRFKPGDSVFGYLGQSMGANAEYLCIPESKVVTIKPDNLTFEEAACIPYGGIMALNLLRKGNIKPGHKILINGASGGIGSAVVQIAKNHYGAEVTGVCGTPRLDYVKSLGADKVIDYTKEDFTQNGETYNLIFDILGKSSFSKCKNSLKENGIHLFASFKIRQLFQMLWTSLYGSKKVVCAMAPEKTEDLKFVKKLIEAGKIRPIIDRQFTLDQAAEAHRYVETGNKKGQVVIVIG